MRLTPGPPGETFIMASSSLTFEVYAPQATASAFVLWREQLRAWTPVLAFTVILAFESTSYLGADRTSAPLRQVAEALFGYDACVNWEAIHHLIRKAGHFIGYGIFSFLCFRAFWIILCGVASRMLRQLRAFALSILTTFLPWTSFIRALCQTVPACSAMCCWTPAAA